MNNLLYLGSAGHASFGHHKHGDIDKYGAHHGGKYGHLLGSYGHHGYGHHKDYAPVHAYHHQEHHYPHHYQHHEAYPSAPVATTYHAYGHVPYAASQAAPVVEVAPVGPHVGVLYQ